MSLQIELKFEHEKKYRAEGRPKDAVDCSNVANKIDKGVVGSVISFFISRRGQGEAIVRLIVKELWVRFDWFRWRYEVQDLILSRDHVVDLFVVQCEHVFVQSDLVVFLVSENSGDFYAALGGDNCVVIIFFVEKLIVPVDCRENLGKPSG